MDNVYVELTTRFNTGRLRAVISSGQAVVLHRLAIMSKDGDWIIREDEECTAHLLAVLEGMGARYRFGAPLDVRWLSGGWSSHFEFMRDGLRVRTDFVSRPPRLPPERLSALWSAARTGNPPFVGLRDLADLKKTNREKDYAVIGELARLMVDPEDRLLYSRSARDLIELAAQHPGLVGRLAGERPLLRTIAEGLGPLEAALDAERRALIHQNEERLARYMAAAQRWESAWKAVERETVGLPLSRAHELLVARARDVLPTSVTGGAG